MKNVYLLILSIFIFYTNVNSQIRNLPKNAKAGDCYIRCFNYKTEINWEKVDCSLAKKGVKGFKRTEESIKKLITYQKKLIVLGYDLSVSGFPDDSTINAHNKYISKKRKKERKKRRMEKKQMKKERRRQKKLRDKL